MNEDGTKAGDGYELRAAAGFMDFHNVYTIRNVRQCVLYQELKVLQHGLLSNPPFGYRFGARGFPAINLHYPPLILDFPWICHDLPIFSHVVSPILRGAKAQDTERAHGFGTQGALMVESFPR